MREWVPAGPALFYYPYPIGKAMTATSSPRYVRESAQEKRIAAIVEPVAENLGYHLVRVRVTNENGCTLQIMCEDASGHFTIADCEALNADLSPVLDLEDPIDREYHLEISSPGVDRPLVRARDFKAWIGHEAKIELAEPIEGRKRYRGDIVDADDQTVSIRLSDAKKDEDRPHVLPLASIGDAKLMMTDRLLDAARKAQDETPDFDADDPDVETIYDESGAEDGADTRN